MKSPHYDGWGHRILGYFDMLTRFGPDNPSRAILRRLQPYRYVVMPDVQIIVKKRSADELHVVLTWPCETRRLIFKCNDRRMEALRRLYRSGDLAWRRIDLGDEIMFSRPGVIIRNKGAVDYSTESER